MPAPSVRWSWRVALAALVLAALGAGGWALWRWQPERWAQRHLDQARVLAAAHQDDGARAQLRLLLERLPRHREARWQLIQLEMQAHRFEQAYLQLKAYTELFPEQADAWLLVAVLMNTGGLLEEAEAAADNALAADPAHAEARTLRATIRLRRGRWFGASLDARAALARAGADVALWSVLSQCATAIESPAAGADIARKGLAATHDDPLLRVVLAKRLVESGRTAAALAELAQAEQSGNSPDAARAARVLHARVLAAGGRPAAAVPLLDAVLRERPFDGEAATGRVLIDAAAGRTADARARLEQMAAYAPPQYLAPLRQRVEGNDRESLRQALDSWVRLPLQAPRGGVPPDPARIRAAAHRERGEIAESHSMVWPGTLAELRRDSDQAIQKKDWAAAAAVVAKARQAYPGTAIGPWIAGVVEMSQERYAPAEGFFQEALRSAPRSALVTKGLAQAWLKQSSATAAADRLMELAQRDPGFAFARRHAAATYLNARRPDLAEAALRQGADHPGDAGAWRDLADFYRQVDRASDALKACRDGAARFPADLDLLACVATLEQQGGNADAAIAALDRIVTREPDRDAEAVALARLLAARPDAESRARARALLRGAALDAPADLALVDAIGWTTVALGDAAGGTPWLEAAAKAAPERGDLHYHLGAAYARAGRKDAARAELKSALGAGAPFAEQPEAQKLLQALDGRS